MTEETAKLIKQHIYVYWSEAFGSMGIYLADSKEDALRSINEDLWEKYDWENYDIIAKRPVSKEEKLQQLIEKYGEGFRHIAEAIAENKTSDVRPFDLGKAVEIYTLEEWQEQQKFFVSERLIEISDC